MAARTLGERAGMGVMVGSAASVDVAGLVSPAAPVRKAPVTAEAQWRARRREGSEETVPELNRALGVNRARELPARPLTLARRTHARMGAFAQRETVKPTVRADLSIRE